MEFEEFHVKITFDGYKCSFDHHAIRGFSFEMSCFCRISWCCIHHKKKKKWTNIQIIHMFCSHMCGVPMTKEPTWESYTIFINKAITYLSYQYSKFFQQKKNSTNPFPAFQTNRFNLNQISCHAMKKRKKYQNGRALDFIILPTHRHKWYRFKSWKFLHFIWHELLLFSSLFFG